MPAYFLRGKWQQIMFVTLRLLFILQSSSCNGFMVIILLAFFFSVNIISVQSLHMGCTYVGHRFYGN